MDIVSYFEAFWKAKASYLQINNPERTHRNLIEKLSTLDDFYQIDEYVCSLRTNKESTRRIMVAFFDYLKSKEDIPVESVLYNKRFYDYPIERELEIAKFLHEPRTIREIESRFDINDRTIRGDLQALENGIEVLGSTIKIIKKRENRKYYYESTMHPIFLALNLTEVNAITHSLEEIAGREDGIYPKILRDIVNRIKSQLSPYAFKKLFPNTIQPKGNNYLSEDILSKDIESALGYLYKSRCHFKFIYKCKEYGGRLQSAHGDLEIKLDDGSILRAKRSEIKVILDSYEYK